MAPPDPAEQLQRLYLAGFDLQTFDRFPKCVGVIRDNCIALLVPGPEGLQVLGTPGWRMGEVMGVLTEAGGRQVFQAKRRQLKQHLNAWRNCASFTTTYESSSRRMRHRSGMASYCRYDASKAILTSIWLA